MIGNILYNLNVIAYFHVDLTNYDTSLLGGKCIAEKILVELFMLKISCGLNWF